MKTTRIIRLATALVLAWSVQTFALPENAVSTIDKMMTNLHERGQFNGSILVATNGEVIYRNAYGDADVELRQRFTPETRSCLASVAKTFTAMAILMLSEQDKLNCDDPVSKHIPEFSRYANIVTVRQLLTHTSGIPDVGDLGIDRHDITNKEVIKAILSKQDSFPYKPGEKYHYSNTGYTLLHIIVENITGQPYSRFIEENIFKPLGMSGTFFVLKPMPVPESVAVAYDQFGKKTGYNTGMYSNVDDLLKWDQALYTETLVRQSTLAEAFTPGGVKQGSTTYGFGWNVAETDDNKFVWHTGSTGGYRAFIERRITENITVIMLTNRGNSKRSEIKDAVLHILAGKPYALPKRSIAELLYNMINEKGIEPAVRTYRSLKANNDEEYDFGEPELNSLGYQLLSEKGKVNEAIQIFELNTLSYPTSSNTFDSIGEAYKVSGNKELAIKNYEKALELDPNNLNARNMLKGLK